MAKFHTSLNVSDRQLTLGGVLEPLAKDDKAFWLRQVRGTTARSTWKDSTSRQMLAMVLRHFGPQWPGFAVLHDHLPPENWADLEQAIIQMLKGQ